MTALDWREQATRAFRSAMDGASRVTGSAEAARMTALHAALDVAEPLIRQQVCDELGRDHYVTFTEDRWTVEHSVACRLSGRMSECEYHAAVDEVFWGAPDPDQLGRWRISGIDSAGMPDLERAEPVS